MSYISKVHMDGADTEVVESGGQIRINSGGMITAAGTQASAITDTTAITGGDSPTEAEHNAALTKIDSILAALRGVGIIAT